MRMGNNSLKAVNRFNTYIQFQILMGTLSVLDLIIIKVIEHMLRNLTKISAKFTNILEYLNHLSLLQGHS